MLFHPDFKRRLTRISIVLAGVVGFAASIAEIRTHLLGPKPVQAEPIRMPAPVVVVTSPEAAVAPALPDLPISGAWHFIHTAERTTYNPYRGLESVYRINLRHDRKGNVEGNGELFSEGGVEVTGQNHLLIELEGTFDGEELRISFTVEALRRPFTGSARFLFDTTTGHWIGTYESGAAASSGPARLEPRDG